MSYNAAGVLAHIASDGPEAWTIETPSRPEVLTRMVHAIEQWDLNADRNINYRSFDPILSLVRCYETPECQHWAVWALANLTKVCTVNNFFFEKHLQFYLIFNLKLNRLTDIGLINFSKCLIIKFLSK